GRAGQRGRGRGGDGELVSAGGGGPGSVPDGRGRQLGGGVHVRAVVLDRLEHADGAAERDSLLGVLDGLIGAGPGDARCRGRQYGPGQVGEGGPRVRDDGGGGALEGDPSAAAGRVEVRRRLDADLVAGLDDRHVVARSHQDQPGRGGRQDRAQAAADRAVD